MKLFLIIILNFTLFTSLLQSNASYSQGSTAEELAAQIQGIGITISDPKITYGASSQRGTFKNGKAGAGLEIDNGIILTTMSVKQSFHKNTTVSYSVSNKDNTDPDLTAIDPNSKYNTIVFEFKVTLDANTRLLLLDYQFASEEYPEYVGSKYNDAFGFFISGGDLPKGTVYNIARVVDNQTYVTIKNINKYKTVTVNNVNDGHLGDRSDGTTTDLTNSAFFIDNNQNNDKKIKVPSPIIIEYDGITKTLHATLDNLTPGETYNFKIAIADTSDQQLNTGVFINKINGLREPSICYDYAYKQNGSYLTEAYNDTTGPYISGDVIGNNPKYPIEVAMFIKNTKDSEILATNVSLDIFEIDTKQATYKKNSIFVVQPGETYKTKINDVDVNVSASYVQNIPIDSFAAFEHFYTYFSLDPLTQKLNLPIKARINYDLSIPLSPTESLTIPRSSLIDSEVPICGDGTNNFEPVYGIFNIIENGLYKNNSKYFYNLNTQVTNREADLSVVTIDVNETTNADLHNLISGVSTVVGIDMLDLKSFHYTGASCSESGNSLTSRSWVIIDKKALTPLTTNNIDFYKKARENVAMRISYAINEDDNSVLQLEKVSSGSSPRWNIVNFTDRVKKAKCANGAGKVSKYCTNEGTSASSAMSSKQLATCMECVYGLNTKLVCARDNFAIRPEAFLISMDDQDQEKTAPLQRITNGLSGVAAPANTRLNVAAGYEYHLDINATNHLNNTASESYNFHMNTVKGTTSSLEWSPRAGQKITGCNDISDKDISANFINGNADGNTSFTEVGDYKLSILDTVWTSIDSVQQSHHTGSYFLNGSDCVLNSNYVGKQKTKDAFTGCNISSTHTSSNDSNLQFLDLSLSIQPYKFSLAGIKPSVGIKHQALQLQIAPNPSYVYMSHMANTNDQNMSFHLNGIIKAVGYNDLKLSNFVNNCYAKPLDLNITKSNTTLVNSKNGAPVLFQSRFRNLDYLGAVITKDDINTNKIAATKDINIPIPQSYFTKRSKGEINTILDINFDRNNSLPSNPISVTYSKYKVNCSTKSECLLNADLKTNKDSEGNVTIHGNTGINGSISHYYGRTNAPRQRFVSPIGASNLKPAVDFIYYEVYCNGVGCQKALLQGGVNATSSDDPRWFINPNHTKAFGTAGTVNQKGSIVGGGVVVGTATSGKHLDSTNLVYDATRGYPYKTSMQNTPSTWLLYDQFNSGSTQNQFEVEFDSTGSWAGVQENTTTTGSKAAVKTNRRSMW